jgi:beta-phosphoglucomutase-like phosphatase (HAD superfamily)
VGASWWSALAAAEAGLTAAGASLPPQELRDRIARLAHERSATVELLDAVAHAEGDGAWFSHLLVPRSGLRRLLGLPSSVQACVFDLDGVLVGSTPLHAAAWAETFDPFLSARSEPTGRMHAPFDPHTDYLRRIHGKQRLEGVRAFLASRGISLPEGDALDPPGTETVHGLANRKRQALMRRLDEQGVEASRGSSRYLQLARAAGLRRAVVSGSANLDMILERAGLAGLVEDRIDGGMIVARRLRARPAPDVLLAACTLLGCEPENAAAFETTPAGVAAARTAGSGFVVGIDASGHAEPLRAAGADVVVTSLQALLERNLAVSSNRR